MSGERVNGNRGEVEVVEKLGRVRDDMLREIHKVIVGQDRVIEQVLTAMFCRGHCLLVGVPGLAKTLLISTIARLLRLKFNRIQFTPDLMPSDITGTELIESSWPTRSIARRPRRRPRFFRRCRSTR